MSEKSTKDWRKFKDEHDMADDMPEIDDVSSSDEADHAATQGTSLDHPSYTALEEQLTLAEQKAHESWEKSIRAMAELDNVRRRAERDVAHAHRYGVEKLISALLPVLDSLEQALQLAVQHTDTSMHQGLELTMKLFLDALEKQGVQQFSPEGQVFNPEEHEAMSIQESAEVPHNSVLFVVQKGYRLSDRVIRPARVIVAKNVAS